MLVLCCRAKKSAQHDFVVYDFDLSSDNVTFLLEILQASNVDGGLAFGNDVTLVTSSAALLVETDAGFYGDFSTSFFLDAKGNGVSTMLGVQTKSTSIAPGSILIGVVGSAFDPSGNFLAQFFAVYPSTQVTLKKGGLPTLSSIIDTIV